MISSHRSLAMAGDTSTSDPGALLNGYKAALESFASTHLDAYIGHLVAHSVPRHRKEFNDPVWKTLVLYPLEIAILDAPLLQRLRRIRQLGVAHWVYPGATHSRLEHTIGVVHQVQRLITSINTHVTDDTQPFIDQEWTNLLRLTALCHDIGHGTMSHVSEKAIRTLDAAGRVEREFARRHGVEGARLGEIAAYYMVGSPSFARLLEVVQGAVGAHVLPPDAVSLMQKTIIGTVIRDDIPLLHELISGPFDADKLDYMPRDAHMSGIPVVTDVDRLIEKVRAVKVTQDELPHDVARVVEGGRVSYTMTGIDLSGARTLDELMLGRTLLFDKIYRHQKVRAAEVMVASILLSIADLVTDTPIFAPFVFADDALLEIDEAVIAHRAKRPLTSLETARVAVASDVARRLKDRQLFVRAYAFAQTMPLDPYRGDARHQSGLEKMLRDVKDAERRDNLLRRICSDVREIVRLLGKQSALAALAGDDIAPYVRLDPPETPPSPGDAARAYLIANNRRIIPFKDDFAGARAWTDAYPLTRDIGYIFAPEEIAPYVFLAAEKVVRGEYDVRLPSSMVAYAKQDARTLNRLRSELTTAGYYVSSPFDLRPMPQRLTMADVQSDIAHIVRGLSGYSGVASQEARDRHQVTLNDERILDWLRQFETDELIDAALRVARKVRLIGRDDVVATLKTFMDGHPAFEGGFLCPLGEPKDSSAVVTYYAGDVAQQYGLRVRSLDDALARGRPIIFVDDLIGSGNQTASILETWLGLQPVVDLKEERQPLTLDQGNLLRGRPLGFVFAGGLPQGVERLRQRISELGLDATVEVGETNLPRAFEPGTFASTEQETAFRAICETVARGVLLDLAKGHDEAWTQNRVFGYGNDALLVIFPYNTPTQTLTCLWARGNVAGAPWVPLFPRRPKT